VKTGLEQATKRLKQTIALLAAYDREIDQLLDAAQAVLDEINGFADEEISLAEFIDQSVALPDLQDAINRIEDYRWIDPDEPV
jgi:ABC-type transporter Mla subunit MlaD